MGLESVSNDLKKSYDRSLCARTVLWYVILISNPASLLLQKFFRSLKADMKIDLENIVYFRSDTHYFVMTAKKDSLLERGVIKKDTYDRDTMLRSDNIDRKQLEKFAIDASQVRKSLIINLFLTSKNETTNSPIQQFTNLKYSKMSLK